MIIAFVPRFLLARLTSDAATAWHINVVLSHLILLAALPLAAILFAGTDRLPHFCAAREFLGLPCPGCGITSGLRSLSQANVAEAWAANPAATALAGGVLLQLFLHLFALGCCERRTVCNLFSRRVNWCGAAALLGVWLIRLF